MSDPQKPTRVRHGVVAFVSALAVILYIDRVCFSKTQGQIQKAFELTDAQLGWIFSAFTFAYAIFEIPAGWLGDRFGPRKVLLRIVLWWSFFTAATGWTIGFVSLIVTRFLFGAGEAGCFPNTAKAYSIWLPSEERNRAQSWLWICARWGGAFTPFLVYAVLQVVSWRWAFAIFGALGLIWAVCFHLGYHDDPRKHPGANEAERALLAPNFEHAAGHGDVPWRAFLRSRTTWFLWIQYWCFSWTWYFYISWLPRFLDDRFPGELDQAWKSLLTGLPLFLGGIGSFSCGFLAPWVSRRYGTARARRVLAGGGFLLAAGILMLTLKLHSMTLVLTLLGVSCFLADFVIPVSWGACIDVGGRSCGSYSGAMNMMGNLGGAVAQAVIGHLLVFNKASWDLVFCLNAGAFVIGAVCWLFIDPVTRLDDAAPARAG